MLQIVRDVIFQPFSTFVIAVAATPTPILPNQTKTDLIDSFVLSLDAAAANNVFIGDQAVTVNSGLEIVRGAGPLEFRILNQKQQYELQEPLIMLTEQLGCKPQNGRAIPFILWDLSQIYLIAAAPTNVRCAAFRSQFI